MAKIPMQPGYDGEVFSVEAVRDHGGKGKRELERRMRYDVVEWLYRQNPALLSLEQRDAAVKLQVDDQLSKTPVIARVGTMGVSKSETDYGLSEAVMDATKRVREAKSYLGLQWSIVECVVLSNVNLSRTAVAFGIKRLAVLPRLHKGLDQLGEYYEVES